MSRKLPEQFAKMYLDAGNAQNEREALKEQAVRRKMSVSGYLRFLVHRDRKSSDDLFNPLRLGNPNLPEAGQQTQAGRRSQKS